MRFKEVCNYLRHLVKNWKHPVWPLLGSVFLFIFFSHLLEITRILNKDFLLGFLALVYSALLSIIFFLIFRLIQLLSIQLEIKWSETIAYMEKLDKKRVFLVLRESFRQSINPKNFVKGVLEFLIIGFCSTLVVRALQIASEIFSYFYYGLYNYPWLQCPSLPSLEVFLSDLCTSFFIAILATLFLRPLLPMIEKLIFLVLKSGNKQVRSRMRKFSAIVAKFLEEVISGVSFLGLIILLARFNKIRHTVRGRNLCLFCPNIKFCSLAKKRTQFTCSRIHSFRGLIKLLMDKQ